MIVGFDPGNSETTLLVPQGEEQPPLRITIPSHVGSGYPTELLRIRGGAAETVMAPDEYVLEHQGQSYFVGDLAMRESPDSTTQRGSVERYWDGHSRLLLLTTLASVADDREGVRVVTGMPVSVWSKARVKHVQQSLVGEHQVVLSGTERTITIDAAMVLMEGAGANIAYGQGAKVPQYVVDVGDRTTDLFKSVGHQPVLDQCNGAPIGILESARPVTS